VIGMDLDGCDWDGRDWTGRPDRSPLHCLLLDAMAGFLHKWPNKIITNNRI